MLVVHSPQCLLHNPKTEILSGKAVPYKESPDRLVLVRNALERDSLNQYTFVEVGVGLDVLPHVLRVHSKDYIDYLRTAYENWVTEGGDKAGVFPEAFPHTKLPPRKLDVSKMSVIAKAGFYCFDLSCPITADTYTAVVASARVAVYGAQLLTGTAVHSRAGFGVFALTRPPGHHAATGLCGGYCYLNNAAIAVRALQDVGEARVAVLDIDYHHGNGSQDIFYSDGTVFYTSLHAEGDYPYFTGAADERGEGAGLGCNLNIPLAQHTTSDEEYLSALNSAARAITDFAPKFLVVSLGVDTYKDDPICCFALTTPCYRRIGARIRSIELPTLFIFEGGYCMEALGDNVKGVLDGFLAHDSL